MKMDKCVFNFGKKCFALTKKNCSECSFRKTEKELEEGQEKARARLKTLPIEQREHIRAKYGVR